MASEEKKPARVDPVELEVKKVPTVTLDFRGYEFVMPASLDQAAFDVVVAIDDQKFSHAIKGLLHDDEWQTFLSLKLTVDEAGEFFSQYAALIGLNTAGE